MFERFACRITAASLLAATAFLFFSGTAVVAGGDSSGIVFDPHGLLAYDAGQIIKGYSSARNIEINHSWQQKLLMQITFTATIRERLRIILSPELAVTASYLEWPAYDETHLPGYQIYPNHAEGIFRFEKSEHPVLEIGAGIFPLKYNPDVRNLGEYLFRSGPNGIYKMGNFDFAFARLMGIRLGSTLWESLHQDLLLYSEYNDIITLQDYSLAYLADYSFHGLFDVGVGAVAHNLLSVDKNRTTPKTDDNKYRVADTLEGGQIVVTDSGYFSYAGEKLMIRGSVNPAKILPWKMLKENDLKLYGEIDLLGVRDYPVIFTDFKKRMVYSAGFNIPTYPLISYEALTALQMAALYKPWTKKVQVPASIASVVTTAALGGATWAVRHFFGQDFSLDLLALELSWDHSDYPNNYYYLYDGSQGHLPQPFPALTHLEKWCWSIYAVKQLTRGFELHAQIARDRMRPVILSTHYVEHEEVLQRSDDWHWDVRVMYSF